PRRDRAPGCPARRNHHRRQRARPRHALPRPPPGGWRRGTTLTMARVLIADDEESIRMVLGTALAQAGHDVQTVATGAAALAALTGGDFDVAILDIRMPDMSGLDVLERVRGTDP